MLSPELKELIEKRFGRFRIDDRVGFNYDHYYPYNGALEQWFISREKSTGLFVLSECDKEYSEQELIRVLRLYAFI